MSAGWLVHSTWQGIYPVAALIAVHAAVRHLRNDLVKARRRLRIFVLASAVLYTLAQLALRLSALHGRLSEGVALLDMAGLLVIAAGVTWRLARLASTELFPVATPATAPAGIGALDIALQRGAPSSAWRSVQPGSW